MAIQTKTTLKGYFFTGATPTQSNFENLIDSLHLTLADGSVNTSKIYFSANATGDTANDWRIFGDSAGFYVQICTVANATKGSGTWVTKFQIEI